MRSITIRTTQNVSIEYELASSTNRISAFIVDILLVGFSYLLLTTIFLRFVPLPEMVLFFFLPLLLFLTYYFLCDLLWQGQTVGKRSQRIKVVRADGKNPTPGDFLLRALFLLPDAWFSAGIPAILLINTTLRAQRLGDMVANTVVIKTLSSKSFALEDILNIQNRQNYEPVFPGVQHFAEEDMLLIKQALTRAQQYRNRAHNQALDELCRKCLQKLNIDTPPPMRTDEFLRTLLQDYIVLTR